MIPNEETHSVLPCLTTPSEERRSESSNIFCDAEHQVDTITQPLSPVTQATNLPIETMVVGQPNSLTTSTTSQLEESEELTLQLQSKLGQVTSNDTDDSNNKPRKSYDLSAEELLGAFGILNGLAAMDSSDYHATLLEGSSISNRSEDFRTLLEHPQVAKLYQNIHRLHSLVSNLTAENDHQTAELLDLHQELQAKNHRVNQLEEAVTKLHKRNTKLKAQSKSNQSKAKKMIQQLQEFTAKATKRQQEDDFTKLAMQIQHHEVVLNRQRTDSNFSDLDGLQDFLPDTSSIASDLDAQSTSSSVFDDGIATLRISREPSEMYPRPGQYCVSESDNVVIDPQHLEELGTISRRQQERDSACTTPPRILQSKQGNQNPFAKLLGPRTAHPYTLEFLEPCQLQFVALLVRLNNDDASLIYELENENFTTAFAVCGYHGFDSALNVKPALGARLLQINKQDVDSTWTVQELEKHLRELGPRATMTFRNDSWSKTQKDTLQMAIQEQELLHPEASSSHQQINFVNPFNRIRSQSSDSATRPGIFGKWNFPGTNRSSVDAEKPQSITSAFKEVSQRGSGLFRSSTGSDALGTASTPETKFIPSTTVEYNSSDYNDRRSPSLTGSRETDVDVVSEQTNVDNDTADQLTIPESLGDSQQLGS